MKLWLTVAGSGGIMPNLSKEGNITNKKPPVRRAVQGVSG